MQSKPSNGLLVLLKIFFKNTRLYNILYCITDEMKFIIMKFIIAPITNMF